MGIGLIFNKRKVRNRREGKERERQLGNFTESRYGRMRGTKNSQVGKNPGWDLGEGKKQLT